LETIWHVKKIRPVNDLAIGNHDGRKHKLLHPLHLTHNQQCLLSVALKILGNLLALFVKADHERSATERHVDGSNGIKLVWFENFRESVDAVGAAHEGVRGEGKILGLGVDLTVCLEEVWITVVNDGVLFLLTKDVAIDPVT
jgi:hypothetical protein